MIKTGELREDSRSDYSEKQVKYISKDGKYVASEGERDLLDEPVALDWETSRNKAI